MIVGFLLSIVRRCVLRCVRCRMRFIALCPSLRVSVWCRVCRSRCRCGRRCSSRCLRFGFGILASSLLLVFSCRSCLRLSVGFILISVRRLIVNRLRCVRCLMFLMVRRVRLRLYVIGLSSSLLDRVRFMVISGRLSRWCVRGLSSRVCRLLRLVLRWRWLLLSLI